MYYYSHNIADFNHATRHLDRVERSIYRDLIELYYDLESAIPNDLQAICRKICARRDDEPQIVEAILGEFFTLTDGCWWHERCEKEISIYRAKADANRVNGKKGGRPPKTQTEPNETQMVSAAETQTEPNETLTNNQEPITNNHKPVRKKHNASYDAIPDLVAAGVDRQKAVDWLAVRKTKRAAETKTAIDGVLKNIAAYGISADEGIQICCERGWAGFEGAWLNARASPVRPIPTSSNAAVMERWLAKKTQEVA